MLLFLVLYYCLVFSFCSSGKDKYVHLLFAQTRAICFRHCCFIPQKSRCMGMEIDLTEPIADWSDLGVLTFVSCPVYVSSVPGPSFVNIPGPRT